jgi:catechol 2,3-dioxygenase-like lactoylglutathione lyase family enzyme
MKIVPVIKSSDLQRSLHFYAEVLDFERKWPGYEDREMANGVMEMEMGFVSARPCAQVRARRRESRSTDRWDAGSKPLGW